MTSPIDIAPERHAEITRRHQLGRHYFEVGKLYKLNTFYKGIIKEFDLLEEGKRKRTDIPKGSIVLCTKNEQIVYPNGNTVPYSIIEFLFGEIVLHYVSDAWQLCEVMDPMLQEKEEESHE